MLPAGPTWFDAWIEAAYGPGGFWPRSAPAEHFATSATLGPDLAEAVLSLLDRRPAVSAVLEVGAGDGRLLSALHRRRPDLGLAGVDLRPRPAGLPSAVAWQADRWDVRSGGWTTSGAAALLAATAGPLLVLAVEWLDDLPCRTAASGDAGWAELGADLRPVGPLPPADRSWLQRWWPAGHRAEVGTTRDRAWAALVAALPAAGGLALLVDYGHERDHRPLDGSLAGYRSGRAVPAVPAPDRNLTAHVAVDAVQAAGEAAGGRTVFRRRQAAALADLLPAPPPAPDELAGLAARSRRAALTSSTGWGRHWWLLQEVPARAAGSATAGSSSAAVAP